MRLHTNAAYIHECIVQQQSCLECPHLGEKAPNCFSGWPGCADSCWEITAVPPRLIGVSGKKRKYHEGRQRRDTRNGEEQGKGMRSPIFFSFHLFSHQLTWVCWSTRLLRMPCSEPVAGCGLHTDNGYSGGEWRAGISLSADWRSDDQQPCCLHDDACWTTAGHTRQSQTGKHTMWDQPHWKVEIKPLSQLLPYGYAPDWVKPSFVIFDIQALWRSRLSVRVPGCQKLQMTLNLVWHRMLYSCTHMATVGVKGLRAGIFS